MQKDKCTVRASGRHIGLGIVEWILSGGEYEFVGAISVGIEALGVESERGGLTIEIAGGPKLPVTAHGFEDVIGNQKGNFRLRSTTSI